MTPFDHSTRATQSQTLSVALAHSSGPFSTSPFAFSIWPAKLGSKQFVWAFLIPQTNIFSPLIFLNQKATSEMFVNNVLFFALQCPKTWKQSWKKCPLYQPFTTRKQNGN